MIIEYDSWKEEHRNILEKFNEKFILLLFSGGKDSSVALDLLEKASREFDFQIHAHTVAFPTHRYNNHEKQRIDNFWNKRGININWHYLDVDDSFIENNANPCLPCQKVRRKIMKSKLGQYVEDLNQLVIIVNYSLWDLVSYGMEYLLGDRFNKNKKENNERSKRFLSIAQRFYPIITMNDGYTIFRPLIKYNGSQILNRVQAKGIPILSIPCRYRGYRPKRLLENYYERMGLHFDYNEVFDFAREALEIPDIESYLSIEKEKFFLEIF